MLDIWSLSQTSFQNLPDFVYYIINFAISVSALIAVVSLVISGFRYILSFGDDKKIKAATQSLLYSLLGLILVFIAPIIIKFVINTIINIQ